MDDTHVAYLVLLAVSSVDGSCLPCVQGSVDDAMREHPELDWERAARLLMPSSVAEMMMEAVQSSRRMLVGEPRRVCSYRRRLARLARTAIPG